MSCNPIGKPFSPNPHYIPFTDDGMAYEQREAELPINEAELTKGQVRKLNALRKSIGDDLADEVFEKWLQHQASAKSKEQQDPIAARIAEALAELATDPTFKLGNYGYTVVRARGHGASGLSVRKNTKPISGTGGLNHENPGHSAGDSGVAGENLSGPQTSDKIGTYPFKRS